MADTYNNFEGLGSIRIKINAIAGELNTATSTNTLHANRLTELETALRPVALGGTGSATASGALVNLGLTATAAEINTALDGVTATAAELNILDGATVTATEVNYLGGVTSGIQAQLNAKAPTASPTFTGQAVFPDGSASVPAITFLSDSGRNSGFYHTGDGVVRVSSNGQDAAYFLNTDFYCYGNVTAYSDERLKENVQTITGALDKVKEMRGVTYTRAGNPGVGVIAQEVQKVVPEAVLDDGSYLSVAYGNLVGVLIEAIKELKTEVDALKEQR